MEQQRIMESSSKNLKVQKSILDCITSFDDIVDHDYEYESEEGSVLSATNGSISSEDSVDGFDSLKPSTVVQKKNKTTIAGITQTLRKITLNGPKPVSDPTEGITDLPPYMKGGLNCEGFGQLLSVHIQPLQRFLCLRRHALRVGFERLGQGEARHA